MKTKSTFRIVLLGAFVFLAQHGFAQAGSEKARDAIDAANKKFTDAVAKGDATALAALYAEDAWLLPPGADIVKGRKAIQKNWQDVLDDGVKSVRFTTLAMDAEDDLAVDIGTATLIGADGKELETVKYVTVWKRANKQWLIQRDTWNGNTPAAAK